METSHIVWLKDFQRNLEGSFLEKHAVFFIGIREINWSGSLSWIMYFTHSWIDLLGVFQRLINADTPCRKVRATFGRIVGQQKLLQSAESVGERESGSWGELHRPEAALSLQLAWPGCCLTLTVPEGISLPPSLPFLGFHSVQFWTWFWILKAFPCLDIFPDSCIVPAAGWAIGNVSLLPWIFPVTAWQKINFIFQAE